MLSPRLVPSVDRERLESQKVLTHTVSPAHPARGRSRLSCRATLGESVEFGGCSLCDRQHWCSSQGPKDLLRDVGRWVLCGLFVERMEDNGAFAVRPVDGG